MNQTDAATCTTIDTEDNPTDNGKSNMNQNQNQPKSRKARWKPALMKQEHDYWKHSTNSGLSLENNENITHKHTSNWLETHLFIDNFYSSFFIHEKIIKAKETGNRQSID